MHVLVLLLAAITWETDLQAARTRATQQGKLLFIEFTTDSCKFCKELKTVTYPRKDVQAWLAGVVALRVPHRNTDLLRDFEVADYPTLILELPTGETLYRESGAPRPARFVEVMGLSLYNRLVATYKTKQWEQCAKPLYRLRTWFPGTALTKEAETIAGYLKDNKEFLAAYASEAAEAVAALKRRQVEQLEAEANALYKKGKRRPSYEIYKKIIKQHPKTEAAERARKLLKKRGIKWD